MLPARGLLSIETQNISPLVRSTDKPSSGAVVTPDRFGGTALGSSLNPSKGYCFTLYSSSILSMLKIFIFFLNTACFLPVKYTRKISYNRNPVKLVLSRRKSGL
jgi:hypothetical protein